MHFALHLLSLAQVRLGRAPLEGIVPQLDDILPLTDTLVALVQSRLPSSYERRETVPERGDGARETPW